MTSIFVPFAVGVFGGFTGKKLVPQEYYAESAVASVVATAGVSVLLGASAPVALGGAVTYLAFDYFVTPYVVDYVADYFPEDYRNKEVIRDVVSLGGPLALCGMGVSSASIAVKYGPTVGSKIVGGAKVTGSFLKKIDVVGRALEWGVPKLFGSSTKLTKVATITLHSLGTWSSVSYFESLVNGYRASKGEEEFHLHPVIKFGLTASMNYPGFGSFVLVTSGSSVGYFMAKKGAKSFAHDGLHETMDVTKQSLKTAKDFSVSLKPYYNKYSSADGLRPLLHRGSKWLESSVDQTIAYIDSQKNNVETLSHSLDGVYHPLMTPVVLLVPVSLGVMPLAPALGLSIASVSDTLEVDYNITQASEINGKLRTTGDFIWTMVPNRYELLTTNGLQAVIELSAGTWLHQFDKDPASKAFVRDGIKMPSSVANSVLGNEVGGTGVKYGTGSAVSAFVKPACKAYIMSRDYPGLDNVAKSNFANYVCEFPARILHLLDVQYQRDNAENKTFAEFAYDKTSLELSAFALAESTLKTYAVSRFSKAIGQYHPYSKEKVVVAEKLHHVKQNQGAGVFGTLIARLRDEIDHLPDTLKSKNPNSFSDADINLLSEYVASHHRDLGNKVIVHGGKISIKLFETHDYNIAGTSRVFAYKVQSFTTKFFTGKEVALGSHESVYSYMNEAWGLSNNPLFGIFSVGSVVVTQTSFKILNEATHMTLLATSAKAMQEIASQSLIASNVMNVTVSNKQAKPAIKAMTEEVIVPSVNALTNTTKDMCSNVPEDYVKIWANTPGAFELADNLLGGAISGVVAHFPGE